MIPRVLARLILGVGLLAMSAAAAYGQADIGVNAVVRNSVRMKAVTDATYRPAFVRQAVHIGDGVISGEASSLQILLLDKTVFTVGPDAQVTIDRFVYDPDRNASDVALSVARGSFRFMSGRSLSGSGKTAITTPVGSIGVRGTIVEGAVGADVSTVLDGEDGVPEPSRDEAGRDDSQATLVVLRGPGPNRQGYDKPGAIDFTLKDQVISVEDAGMAVLVWGPDQRPFGPFRLSDMASARLADLLVAAPDVQVARHHHDEPDDGDRPHNNNTPNFGFTFGVGGSGRGGGSPPPRGGQGPKDGAGVNPNGGANPGSVVAPNGGAHPGSNIGPNGGKGTLPPRFNRPKKGAKPSDPVVVN